MASGKIRDLKETASDAVEIIREIGTPEVQQTLDKIRDVATIGRDIMQILKEPGWQQNIENMRLISENFNQASERIDRTWKELKETGIIEETRGFIAVAKDKIGSFDTSSQGLGMKDIQAVAVALKEMLESMKAVSDEIKTTISESRRTGGTVSNIQEAAHEVRGAYETLRK